MADIDAAGELMSPMFLLGAVALAQAFLVWRRLLAYLRYFQQEGYEHIRFLRWVQLRSLTDPALWLALVCRLIAGRGLAAMADVPAGSEDAFIRSQTRVFGFGSSMALQPGQREVIAALLFVVGAVLLALAQPDPRRTGKIPLRMTWRAARVLWTAFAIAIVIQVVGQIPLALVLPALVVEPFWFLAIMLAILPLLLIAANALLMPYERGVQLNYELDARQRVRDIKPFVIGITGSYGKSSSKSMLAHMLQFTAPTLAASGSINTLMGVTRHIREELVPGHKFMVVEMGAFKRGSIRRLCQLTPPSAGLITAVGDMHLERFGSTDEIVRAKSELAEAVPAGGLVVANADSPGALQITRQVSNRRVLLYGETSTESLDTRVERIVFSSQGTSFVLKTRERDWQCFTPLLGRPIILNLAGAFTLAVAVGGDPELLVASFRTLKPVSNRLEVVAENGVTWVRDAYNSNQFGFRAALEVVAALPAAHRYLITPGVIEMGAQQFEVNRALSREAAAVCDRTVVVAATNREAFAAGHRDAGRDDRLLTVAGRAEAFRWLKDTAESGDAIVLENDLPDLYERTTGLFWKAS